MTVKRRFDLGIVGVALDPDSAIPKHRQLYVSLREAVLADRLHAGEALPSTRTLAHELGVSRNTVLSAYEQLLSEGYLVGRTGSGTFVAPDAVRAPPPQAPIAPPAPVGSDSGFVSAVAGMLSQLRLRPPYELAPARAFNPAAPPIDLFPLGTWAQLTARRLKDPSKALLSERAPMGYRPLREAIAAHLRETRAVVCDAEQIAVVAGAHTAIFICAMLLLRPEDCAWMEEPGYVGALGALRLHTDRVIPVPVDAEGLDVQAGLARGPRPRLIYITPSHQFPMGSTMSLRRRLDLLRVAEEAKAWIIEDDYDSELRYDAHPLAALQGLDRSGRVIYVGTFNKIAFPALRLAYVVLPHDLVEPFAAARFAIDECPPALAQAVLTDFIVGGFFARYVRKARVVCAERQAFLLMHLERTFGSLLDVGPSPAGSFLLAKLPDGFDDASLAAALGRANVDTLALSTFFAGPAVQRGLLLGYAASDFAAIRAGVDTLARIVATYRRQSP